MGIPDYLYLLRGSILKGKEFGSLGANSFLYIRPILEERHPGKRTWDQNMLLLFENGGKYGGIRKHAPRL